MWRRIRPLLLPFGGAGGILVLLAIIKLALHFLTSGLTDYGYYHDEFYYIACAKRLAWGYVDHPPLAIWLLHWNHRLLGDSLPALRFLPALMGAVQIVVTGLIARQLGGGRFAQGLAGLAVLSAPVFLVLGGFFSVNSAEQLFWLLTAYVSILALTSDQPAWWLLAGALAGLGLMSKHTMVLYLAALAMGMLLTTARRHFATKWLWLGGLVALLIVLPNLLWQWTHGFPSLEFYRQATLGKNLPTSPLGVLWGQILYANPILLPLTLLGLYFLLCSADGKRFRAFGWMYVILVALMIATRSSRPDRICGAFPILFAAGAVMLEGVGKKYGLRRLKPASIGVVLVGAALVAPLSLPILPPAMLARYVSHSGTRYEMERRHTSRLPQYFADRFGWEDMAAVVSKVYHSLPEAERAHTVIFARNYGQAGAMEFYGRKYDLPKVYSGHNNYFFWGPPPSDTRTIITIAFPPSELSHTFEDVRQAAVFDCEYCLDYEKNISICIARKPKEPVAKLWPKVKMYL